MPKLALHRVTSLAQHALEVADGLGLQPEDHVLGLLPPCGTYGYFAAMAGLAAGARTSVFSSFTPSTLIDVVEREKGTFAALIEGIVRPALAGREQDLERLRGLRLLACAGQRNVDLVRLLDTVGVSVINMYGASEVHALSALRSPSEPAEERARPGGRITSPDLHVRVVDLETGAVLPEGQEGELQFNGPQRFEAYLGNPEASAKALTQDGWYRSGDLGFVEAGGTRFGYTSRAADSLRSKGFLVSPAEVEELVMSHPSVVAAEVVGAPDAATGEDLLVAFVVPRIHGALDEAELVAFCRDRAAAYKTPAMVVLVPEIPTVVSANGDKSLKRELRERAVGLIRAQVVATEAS
jgi:fatty-acyl-CoA synthase